MMNEKKWFILKERKVQGPFTYEECLSIEDEAQKTNIKVLFWGRGINEWTSFPEWQSEVEQLSKNAKAGEKTDWRLIIGEKQLGPLSFENMMGYLRNQKDLSAVLVWHEDFDQWKEVYQLPKIGNLLGLATRSFMRLPIQGKVVLGNMGASSEAEDKEFILQSVGEGGIGVSDVHSLHIGDKIQCNVISPYLSSSFRAPAEVVYLANDKREAGLKFVSLDFESKSVIIEYINKFKDVFDS